MRFIWNIFNPSSTSHSSMVAGGIVQALSQTRGHLEADVFTLEACSTPSSEHEGKEEAMPTTLSSFRDWVTKHPNAIDLANWLLSAVTPDPRTGLPRQNPLSLAEDHHTPTFYQSLAGVTHLEEAEIYYLESKFLALETVLTLRLNSGTQQSLSVSSPGGLMRPAYSATRIDLKALQYLVSPPLPQAIVPGLFKALDENSDGHLDFKEITCGSSSICCGPLIERLKFVFKVFDADCDEVLSDPEELEPFVDVMLEAYLEMEGSLALVDRTGLLTLLRRITSAGGASVSCSGLPLDTFLLWAPSQKFPLVLLELLTHVFHVVFGLPPRQKEEEAEVIRGWLRREEERGMQVGQLWYVISMEWWRHWNDWVEHGPSLSTPTGSYARPPSSLSSPPVTPLPPSATPPPSLQSPPSSTEAPPVIITANSEETATKERLDRYHPDSSHGLRSNGPGSSSSVAPLIHGKGNSISDLSQTSSSGESENWSRPGEGLPSVLSVATTDGVSSESGIGGMRRTQRGRSGSEGWRSSPSRTPSPIPLSPGLCRRTPPPPPSRPGVIENSHLLASAPSSIRAAVSLTKEGGKMKKNLYPKKDFLVIPESLWMALDKWYGTSVPLPREVILGLHGPELELYPVVLCFLCHVNGVNAGNMSGSTAIGAAGLSNGWIYGGGAMIGSSFGYLPSSPAIPRRQLCYRGAFSRKKTVRQVFDVLCAKLRQRPDDVRLWLCRESVSVSGLSWRRHDRYCTSPGATGLSNLGNTCFMNAALQCVSNTQILREYFTKEMHLFELNRTNPMGMKGDVAKSFGDLIRDMWSERSRTIAPIKIRNTINQYTERFDPGHQHDSHEFLAFLLNGLHEDLNRVRSSPYAELKDSDGRPDIDVAEEAWENHILRNKSIINDLFCGQLKSKVICEVCGHESVRFDPFQYLTLPLPMEAHNRVEVLVFLNDGSIPVNYGLRLDVDATNADLKKQLSALCKVPPSSLLLVELQGPRIKCLLPEAVRVKPLLPTLRSFHSDHELVLAAFELPKSQDVPSQDSGNASADTLVGALQASNSNDHTSPRNQPDNPGYVVAFHRKMIWQDAYFLSFQRSIPQLFGVPLLLPFSPEVTTHADLYEATWSAVSRLVSPKPTRDHATNHAHDCDDSLGYEYPFTLKAIFIQDPSVQATAEAQAAPASLEHCMDAFVGEEVLDIDQKDEKPLRPIENNEDDLYSRCCSFWHVHEQKESEEPGDPEEDSEGSNLFDGRSEFSISP
ncbi:unnamed protein product [Cyprideis torosa]|uniref:ubiquitinyl hydrolase 1 n=1 Tax=Cyprideis torosa TaxID=163714 RepID=A0A7R8W120_9CRUS|nr:unnamed protein product [Cyprideis torosa]CAG0879349.1 unnamed protein product [Cyprideis torosa]